MAVADITRWPLEEELGVGTFCKVFSAVDQVTGGPVVLKYPLTPEAIPMLEQEGKILTALQKVKSTPYIDVPRLIHISKKPAFVVMQQVGKTLLSIQKERQRMTTKTIIMLGLKALEGMEGIHACGYVHKDIKPDNLTVSLDPSDASIYFIDFGLSSRYERGGTHISYSETQQFEGSPFFASINSMRGVRPSRRDDLESLGYILLFLLQGSLPWFHIQSSNSDDLLSQVLTSREKHPIPSICHSSDYEIRDFVMYCQSLSYTEKPNYDHLRKILLGWGSRLGVNIDWKYDWMPATEETPVFTLSPVRVSHLKRDKKRRSLCYNSPSSNMSELQGLDASPGKMRDSLRRCSIQVPLFNTSESSSTGESSPEMPVTPIRGFDQIPCLSKRPIFIPVTKVPVNEPKTALLPSIVECEEKIVVRKPRRHTCDEVSWLEQRNSES